jgi:hypothetical protein
VLALGIMLALDDGETVLELLTDEVAVRESVRLDVPPTDTDVPAERG